MRIDIKDLKDYMRCPLLYKFVNIDRLPAVKTIDSFYKEYIKLSIFFYYFSMMEKKVKSFDSLVRKWESLWFSKIMIETFNEEVLKQKSNDAILLLSDFYKRVITENEIPIAINFAYEAIFEGEENIQVTGSIDIIKILNDRTRHSETQIVFLTFSKYYPDAFMVKNNLETSIASYAFRYGFKAKEDRIILRSIINEKDIFTSRGGGDFSRAEKIVKNICKGIKNRVFYPTENVINCSKCSYKLFCLNERAL